MANVLYPRWKEALMQSSSNSSLQGNLRAVLVDTNSYTYNSSHQFFSSVLPSVVGDSVALSNKIYVGGILSADNLVFPTVIGPGVGAIVLYIDTGNSSNSRLVAYIDTASGLPVSPNGGDINIIWNISGIFAL